MHVPPGPELFSHFTPRSAPAVQKQACWGPLKRGAKLARPCGTKFCRVASTVFPEIQFSRTH